MPVVVSSGGCRGLRRTVRVAGGWLILGVGVAFGILPIVPGLPLVVLATFLLAPEVPAIARVWGRSKSWWARLGTSAAVHHERFAEDFRRRFEP